MPIYVYAYINSRMTKIGRPRSFDKTAVLTAAMNAFWAGGYAGTTYADLEKATGLRRQSLTYAFGEKPSLFKYALGLYIDLRVKKASELLTRDAPLRSNLQELLDAWEADAVSGQGRGCLLVRATAELENDPQISVELRRGDNLLMRALTDAFLRASASCEISLTVDAAALARLVISTGNGAMIQSVARRDSSVSRAAHDALMQLIK